MWLIKLIKISNKIKPYRYRNLIWLCALIAIVFAAVGSVSAGSEDHDELSAYYGFGEIEIIKLDMRISALRTADFNGDGRNDIAIVNNRRSRIEILLQKEQISSSEKAVAVSPEDEDINELAPVSRFKKDPIAVSQNIFSFVCGDLNSDNLVDIAFYGEPAGLYVILQKPTQQPAKSGQVRTLSWQTRKKIKIDDGLKTLNALVCADLNNDGKDDLALAAHDGIYLVLQNEEGSLDEPIKYPTSARTLGVRVGDLNGDGINDLTLITNDNEKPVHVRFGQKTGQLGPQLRFFIERPHAFQFSNIDNIPGDEIITVDALSKRLICYKLSSKNKPDADWPISFYPLTSGEGYKKRDLVTADLDGDGLLDIVISDPGAAELIFYKQIAGIGLDQPIKFPAFADIHNLSAADIDLDGKTDLGILSIKEKMIGISKFEDDRLTFPKPVNVIGEPVAMTLADMDNDTNIDCVYISRDANDIRTLRVIYNLNIANTPIISQINGDAGETEQPVELKKLTSNPDAIKILDVDQNGLLDILIFVQYEAPVLVVQRSPRKFEVVDSRKTQASLIKDAGFSSIAVADVDEKDGEELLIAQKNFARSLVFAEGKSWKVIDQYNAKGTNDKIIAVGAFDIGGPAAKPSILLLDGQKSQLQILKADSDKTYRFEKQINIGKWNTVTYLKMLFEPLSGDERKNILLFDSEKFALITPPNGNESPAFLDQIIIYETKIKDGKYGNLVAGDINSDSQVDIIMIEYNRNNIEILAIDAAISPIPAMRFKIFEEKVYRKNASQVGIEPRELKIADVTGDGKADLIAVIHDRIIIYPQD